MNFDFFRATIQHGFPQRTLTRLAGIIANCKQTKFKNRLIDNFIRDYGVDMSLAIETDPHAYATFNDFFTRHLKPELRPIVSDENAIACPADGVISQIGNIESGNIFQAKGFHYGLENLVASETNARLFRDGKFVTLYLAPKDYHRVHMPLTGKLQEMIYVPGKLFSVNQLTASHIPNLFARNERVVSIFETDAGPMAVILVGATLVGSINTVWAGAITPPHAKTLHQETYQNKMIVLKRGEEMGHFQLGSTVIVLFGNDRISWNAHLFSGDATKYGQRLGNKI